MGCAINARRAGGSSWLERQNNVKTIHSEHGRTPLAGETGKNWYVRLPNSECAAGQAFARSREAFWALLRETWDIVLASLDPFIERAPDGQPPRFMKMREVEAHCLSRDLSDPDVRNAAKERILEVIEEYRDR